MPVSTRIVLAGLALALLACGPEPLAGIGQGASDWIGEPTVSTTPPTTDPGPALVPVGAATWYNESLTPVPGNTPTEVIAGVYARSSADDRFAQATPAEISTALPGIVFPSELPPDVEYITSQLVFDRTTGTLSTDQVAAFGFWVMEPYTQSRSVGQHGILDVAHDPQGSDLIEAGSADTSCGRFPSHEGECEETEVGTAPAWILSNQTGRTLIWYGGDYRYELFIRAGLDPSLLGAMAESALPLQSLAG
jgi:hypothetical protein